MRVINYISICAMPVMIIIIIAHGLYKKVNIYDSFVCGAKSGIETSFKIIPPLVALLAAIGVFRASGALSFVLNLISPLTEFLKIPKEVMPLALMRPISGSASLAIVSDNLKNFGPDSLIGRITSVMMGSTETTFYTLAVYFGSVGVKKGTYTLKAALCADITGILASVILCRLFFK